MSTEKDKHPEGLGNGWARYVSTTKQYAPNGTTYKVSTALAANVISRHELPLTPSDENGQADLVEGNGAQVSLSPRQIKICLALAMSADGASENTEVKNYIGRLPEMIEYSEPHTPPVHCMVDVREMAKAIYGRKNVGSFEINSVRDDLMQMHNVSQRFVLTGENGTQTLIDVPLLTVGMRVSQRKSGRGEEAMKMDVTLSDVFLYGLTKPSGYQLAPVSILELWNAAGVNSELFSKLLLLLLCRRGIKVKAAEMEIKTQRQEARKAKETDQEAIDRRMEALRRTMLTYQESVPSILQRLEDTKRYWKGKYFRKSNFMTDLNKAVEGLKVVGIISNFSMTTNSTGEEICNFELNPSWLSDAALRIQSKKE